MNAAEARALLFKRQLQILPVEHSLQGLEELDGQLAVLELSAADTSHADKLAEDRSGDTNEALMMAALTCKSLVMRDSKERIFSDTDMGAIDPVTGVASGVVGFGLTVLKPISELVAQVSGLGPNAIQNTKKNLPTTPENGSNTSSQESSDTAPLNES